MFKVGDRVVTVERITLTQEQQIRIGKTSTITYTDPDLDYYRTDDETGLYYVLELHLESIYNSPLAKALREDE